MLARANTTISILRGDTTDQYGDPQPSNTPVKQGIPAFIIERTRTETTADSPEPMIIRYVTGRVGNTVKLQVNDRIKDERSGIIYAVDGFSSPDSTVMATDIRMDLKRIT